LISPDFLDSDYCYNKEMQRALTRHLNGEAKVIPIILRPVHWANAPFSNIQMLPKDALPVTSWSNLDDAFYDVTLRLEQVIRELLSQRKTEIISPVKPVVPSRRTIMVGLTGLTVVGAAAGGLIWRTHPRSSTHPGSSPVPSTSNPLTLSPPSSTSPPSSS